MTDVVIGAVLFEDLKPPLAKACSIARREASRFALTVSLFSGDLRRLSISPIHASLRRLSVSPISASLRRLSTSATSSPRRADRPVVLGYLAASAVGGR